MIREARGKDVPRLVAMGMRFIQEGPYRDEIVDALAATKTALGVMSSPQGKILVAEENDEVIGVIGFIVYPHYFTGKKTANEMMWYVEPEYRKSMTGIILIRAAQRLAKEMGAEKFQFSAPTAEVGKAYEMLGYRQTEVSYQKEL